MAVGIIIEAARARILYDDITRDLKKFSKLIHMKHSNSIGAIFTVIVIYLKVDRPYGRVPMLGGVYLSKLISPIDNFSNCSYVNTVIDSICKPKLQSPEEKLERFNIPDLDHPNLYASAVLFVKYDW